MKKNHYAPLCIFLWKKNHLIEKILNRIIILKEFKKTQIYIFVDYSPKYSKTYIDNKKLIKKLDKYKSYKNIKFILRKKKYGLSKNIILGVKKIIDKHKKIIVLEDDLLVSQDFLTYMNSSLEEYKDKKSIISISAFNHSSYKQFINKNYKYDNFFSLRTSSWGWATWSDRWELFLKKIPIKEIKKNKKLIVNKLGLDVYFSLIQINKYKYSLWAANWCYTALKNNLFTSYPVLSRISNIGFDGSGQGGFSHKYKNNLKFKIKKKYNFSKNISYDGYNQFKFIKSYNQNYIFQYLKFFVPKKLKIFLKKIYRSILNFKLNYDI